jgi:holin-like protein
MLHAIALLLGLQLVGETVVGLTGIPVPGPVLAMALLFFFLLARRSLPEPLEQVSRTLLSHLLLLFVPAGVGVIVYAGLLAREWLPILTSVVGSTLLTIVVTGRVTQWMLRRQDGQQQP